MIVNLDSTFLLDRPGVSPDSLEAVTLPIAGFDQLFVSSQHMDL
jgi:hypothetical protein